MRAEEIVGARLRAYRLATPPIMFSILIVKIVTLCRRLKHNSV